MVRDWNLPGRILQQDMVLMRRLARWHAPRWVRLWMLYASRGGDGWAWCLAGVGVLFFGGRARYDAFASAALAAALGIACFVPLKNWVRRPRPAVVAPGMGAQGRCWEFSRYRDEFSFPSGHSLTAFAVVTAMLSFYPEFGLCLLACALSIAASRLVLGLHFLTDVLAGCMLGTGLGYLSVLMVR